MSYTKRVYREEPVGYTKRTYPDLSPSRAFMTGFLRKRAAAMNSGGGGFSGGFKTLYDALQPTNIIEYWACYLQSPFLYHYHISGKSVINPNSKWSIGHWKPEIENWKPEVPYYRAGAIRSKKSIFSLLTHWRKLLLSCLSLTQLIEPMQWFIHSTSYLQWATKETK